MQQSQQRQRTISYPRGAQAASEGTRTDALLGKPVVLRPVSQLQNDADSHKLCWVRIVVKSHQNSEIKDQDT